jgi:hypothetical protein
MPLDAPPPLGMRLPEAPVPPGGAESGPAPSMTSALGDFAGMGMQGQTVPGLLRVASEMILKAAQLASQQGDQQTSAGLAQAISLLTDLVAAQQQGMGAGPMAGNGMGTPPPSGPMPAQSPQVASPGQQMPSPMLLPRSSMMGP